MNGSKKASKIVPMPITMVPYGEIHCPRCRGKMMTLVAVSNMTLRCNCNCGHRFAAKQIQACCA